MAKILIVDDNKQITSILEEYAKKEGYSTQIARDGQEAIREFEKINPDIIHGSCQGFFGYCLGGKSFGNSLFDQGPYTFRFAGNNRVLYGR